MIANQKLDRVITNRIAGMLTSWLFPNAYLSANLPIFPGIELSGSRTYGCRQECPRRSISEHHGCDHEAFRGRRTEEAFERY